MICILPCKKLGITKLLDCKCCVCFISKQIVLSVDYIQSMSTVVSLHQVFILVVLLMGFQWPHHPQSIFLLDHYTLYLFDNLFARYVFFVTQCLYCTLQPKTVTTSATKELTLAKIVEISRCIKDESKVLVLAVLLGYSEQEFFDMQCDYHTTHLLALHMITEWWKKSDGSLSELTEFLKAVGLGDCL